MGSNMKRLGDVLNSRMQRTVARNARTSLELGTINGDMSLSMDGLNGNIRPSQYMVDIRLTCKDYGDLPSAFRKLRPGDRVLVAWVGNEPIVVTILVSGSRTTS